MGIVTYAQSQEIVPSNDHEIFQRFQKRYRTVFWSTRHRKTAYSVKLYDFTKQESIFRNVRNEKMTRIKNENAPIPPPRKSLNSSRENTPKKKKHQTSHVKEFTIENFVNQVLFLDIIWNGAKRGSILDGLT